MRYTVSVRMYNWSGNLYDDMAPYEYRDPGWELTGKIKYKKYSDNCIVYFELMKKKTEDYGFLKLRSREVWKYQWVEEERITLHELPDTTVYDCHAPLRMEESKALLLKSSRKVGGWVNVDDRLPNKGNLYAVITRDSDNHIGTEERGFFYACSTGTWGCAGRVTHWRELK